MLFCTNPHHLFHPPPLPLRRCVGFLAELSPADPADEAGLQHLQVGCAELRCTVLCCGRPVCLPVRLVTDMRLASLRTS